VSLRDLLLLYGVVGVACAVAVLRRSGPTRAAAVASALATVFVWPLWAPFALGSPPRAASGSAGNPAAVERIRRALAEAVGTVADTPMSDVFSPKVAGRIENEVARVAARMAELSALMARGGLDAQAAAAHLRDLEARGAPERTVVTARLQHESLARLQQLYAADVQALEELADLLEALRTQLLLARFSGSSADGAAGLVGEVWARLEGLGVAFDVEPRASAAQ
jgi:hypothetical protein